MKIIVSIYIYGVGKYVRLVYEAVDKKKCRIVGFIDKKDINECDFAPNVPVYKPEILLEKNFDYIFVSAVHYESVYKDCFQQGITKEKLFSVFGRDIIEDFVNMDKIEICILRREAELLKNQILIKENQLNNLPYELVGSETLTQCRFPIVRTKEELIEKLINEKCSLARFGDSEFNWLLGEKGAWYQKNDDQLVNQLKGALEYSADNYLVAIPDIFGNIDKYETFYQDSIHSFLSPERRKNIYALLNFSRIYYDAWISRPYFVYRDKTKASFFYGKYKQLFRDRDIVMIEGKYTRTGMNNDFFSSAKSVKRILCPQQDAFEKYEKIINAVEKKIRKGALILCTLGPTATVLACRLTQAGYQVIDIGQIDNDYEWHKIGAKKQEIILGKSVAENEEGHYPQQGGTDEYRAQIIIEIE